MQQYFVCGRFDFARWLDDLGVPRHDQRRFISRLTGQQEYTVMQWGFQFEHMPEVYQGFLWGYFQGFAAAQMQMQQQQPACQDYYPNDYLSAQMGMQRFGSRY